VSPQINSSHVFKSASAFSLGFARESIKRRLVISKCLRGQCNAVAAIILLYSILPHNHDGLIILLNILIVFNISNIDKEINKELPEDDLIEDRNILECFLKCFK
jgi:hypothetical protein